MKHHLEEKDSFDLRFYQGYLKKLYSNINKKRDFEDLYGYLDRTCGYLGKAILVGKQGTGDFILPLSWLFSLASGLEIDIQDAVITKYPGICPYCLETHCICYKTGKKPVKETSLHERQTQLGVKKEQVLIEGTRHSLDANVKNVMEIYAINEAIWYISGAYRHIEKIHEEIAEIHEAYGSFRQGAGSADKGARTLASVALEVADVFAWMLGAWGILYSKRSLDNDFIDYYLDGCPVCHASPCICGQFDSRLASLIDFKDVVKLDASLGELATALPMQAADIAEMRTSLQAAIATSNEPMAKASLSQLRDSLAKLMAGSSTSGMSGPAAASVEPIISTIDSMLRLEEYAHRKPLEEFDVFLSYADTDRDAARQLYDFLSKSALTVHMSEKSIDPGAEWQQEIKDALRNSKVLCILTTPASLKSQWVMSECSAAWALDIRIIPVLLRCSTDALPELLRTRQAVDFHEMEKILKVAKTGA